MKNLIYIVLFCFTTIGFSQSKKELKLMGEWYYLTKDNDTQSKSDNLAHKKTFEFKSEYMFKSNLDVIHGEGSWTYDKETKSLILEVDGKKVLWRIKKLNKLGLILVKVDTNEKWYFVQ